FARIEILRSLRLPRDDVWVIARHIPHDPGAPPHRPHDGSDDRDDDDEPFPDSAPTANTLSARAVFGELHLGHVGLDSLLIDRCNCSNRSPQPWHVYS
ncbi:MAG: hypothetical protein WBD40_20995, partial [Tepidisphaeraceae bacterium]